MIQESIQRLNYLCNAIPPLLSGLEEAHFTHKPAPHTWSKKEIIGHLIDSATNNHQRFVRGQFEEVPVIYYDTDAWNDHGYYNQIDSRQIISFWTFYNKQLLALIQLIPEALLTREVNTGGTTNETLGFLIDDYVVHLEHHLHQVVEY
jgi:hypothetical protein